MSRKASARSSATRKSAASRASKPQLQGGYHFKILWVDLTSGESRLVPFGEKFALKYVGGRGFGAKILYDNLPHIKDPLGPENILVIAPRPLTGLSLPGPRARRQGRARPRAQGQRSHPERRGPRRRHRSRRREARSLRHHQLRLEPELRPLWNGRRDGIEEPQGHRPPRRQ